MEYSVGEKVFCARTHTPYIVADRNDEECMHVVNAITGRVALIYKDEVCLLDCPNHKR